MKTFTAPSGATVSVSDDILSLTWSWTDVYDDFPPVEHQIVWFKGDHELIFGTKTEQSGRWVHVPIRNADYRPTSEKTAREMAAKFIACGDD